jgi:DNA-binding response OmpR family regulator
MGTILLVEDDDASRYATARHLTRAGFVVIAVPSTLQALVKVNSGRGVDAFVIDLGMTAGDVPGLLFGLMMHRRMPAAPKLFVTGFPDLVGGRVLPGKVLFKPIDLDELTAEIRASVSSVQLP